MDIQSIINKCKAEKIPEDIIDYVFNQSKVLTNEFFFQYEKMLTIMFDGGLNIDDKYMLNLYKLSIKINRVRYLFDFFKSESVKLLNDELIDLLVNAGMKKFDVIIILSQINKQPEILEDYFDIFETDYFEYIQEDFENADINVGLLLLKKRKEKYIEFFKNNIISLNKSYYRSNFSYIINLTEDDIFFENYFMAKTITFIRNNTDSSTVSNVKRCLVNYLKEGVFEKDFDVVINKFLKGFGKYDIDFYYYFLEGFNLDLSKQFHKNLFILSLKLDLKRTLIKAPKQQIEYMVKNYFDDFTNYIKSSSNEETVIGMKYIFEADKEKSFDFIISFVDTKSTVIKNGVIETLSGYNKLEEYKKLLNSKKAQVREVAVRLIASLGINDETSKLFKEIISKDKSNIVIEMVKEFI